MQLNKISQYSYTRAHQVNEVIEANTIYTSVAGEYVDADAEVNPDELEPITGSDVDRSIFEATENIAKGCSVVASSEKNDKPLQMLQMENLAQDGNQSGMLIHSGYMLTLAA